MFTVILLEHMVIHSFLSDQTPFQSDLRNYRLISLSFRAVKTLIFWKTGKQREYNWQVNLKSFRTSFGEMFKNPWLISCKCTGEFNSAKISTQNIYQYRGYWWEEKKKKKAQLFLGMFASIAWDYLFLFGNVCSSCSSWNKLAEGLRHLTTTTRVCAICLISKY